MKKYKCYIGNFDGIRRGLVIATSQKAAAVIAKTSLHSFRNYWQEQQDIPPLKRETLYTSVNPWKPWVDGICDLPERR